MIAAATSRRRRCVESWLPPDKAKAEKEAKKEKTSVSQELKTAPLEHSTYYIPHNKIVLRATTPWYEGENQENI